MTHVKMPIPSRARCLELGAGLIEHDLHDMRKRSIDAWDAARDRAGDQFDGSHRPIGTSHEGDLMKAVEWATAAATLRLLAEQAKADGS